MDKVQFEQIKSESKNSFLFVVGKITNNLHVSEYDENIRKSQDISSLYGIVKNMYLNSGVVMVGDTAYTDTEVFEIYYKIKEYEGVFNKSEIDLIDIPFMSDLMALFYSDISIGLKNGLGNNAIIDGDYIIFPQIEGNDIFDRTNLFFWKSGLAIYDNDVRKWRLQDFREAFISVYSTEVSKKRLFFLDYTDNSRSLLPILVYNYQRTEEEINTITKYITDEFILIDEKLDFIQPEEEIIEEIVIPTVSTGSVATRIYIVGSPQYIAINDIGTDNYEVEVLKYVSNGINILGYSITNKTSTGFTFNTPEGYETGELVYRITLIAS